MGIFDQFQSNNKNQEPKVSDQLMTLIDVIAPSAISVNPKGINMSGMYSRVFYTVAYPHYLNVGWLEPILNIEKEMDVSIFIHPIDTADTLKKFQKKGSGSAESDQYQNRERGSARPTT